MVIEELDKLVMPTMVWYRHKEYMEMKAKILPELLSPSMHQRTFNSYDIFGKTLNTMRSELIKYKFLLVGPSSGHTFNFEVAVPIDDYVSILEWELYNYIQFKDVFITYVDPEEPWEIS